MKSQSFFKKIIFFIAFTTISTQFTQAQDTLTNNKRYLYTHQNQLSSEIKIDSTLFNKGFVVSFEELISGRIAGLQVTSNSGAPNSGFTIINRGSSNSSFRDTPLIIIDNVIVNSISIPINPNDIESIIMLKDAVDTAVFGQNGAQGVLIINTKKGTKKLQVNYSGKVGINELPKKADVFSADEFRNLINSRFPNKTNLLGNVNMDWQDEIYRTSYSQDHHVAVSGSILNIPLRASIGNTNQNGIVKTSNFNRSTAEFSANPSFFKNHLKIDANIKTNNNRERLANESAISAALYYNPTQPSRADGTNPTNLLNWRNDSFKRNTFVGNILIDYQFHFFKDLRILFNYVSVEGSEQNSLTNHFYNSSVINNQMVFGWQDAFYKNDVFQKNKQYDTWLDYSKSFKKWKSSLNLKFGHTNLNSETKSYTIEFQYPYNYNSSAFYTNRITFFSTLQYNLLNKYDFKFSVTQDRNSNFNQPTSYFPAFGLGWNLKNEIFKNSNTVSLLKFRLGYGSSGAGQKSPNFGYSQEINTQFNSGFAFAFLNNRIWGNIDYYRRINDKTIDYITAGALLNLSTNRLRNMHKIENEGIELAIGGKIISTNHWTWIVNTNTSVNNNKLIHSAVLNNESVLPIGSGNVGLGNYVQGNKLNEPLNSFYVYKQLYDSNGRPIEGAYVDLNGDGLINNLDQYLYKQKSPVMMMGISSALNYKNWEFSFGGRLSLGNYLYNHKNANSNYSSINNPIDAVLYNATKSVNDTQFNSAQKTSDIYVENASFFKMDYINLGYHLKNIFKSKISSYISGTVQNAFTITKYSGQDPESVTGIDGYSYPRPRIYSIGLKINY